MILPIVQSLLVIQERDQRIRALNKDLRDLPVRQKGAEGKLAGDDAAVAATKKHGQEIEVKIKSFELDIQTRRTSISRLKDQQFATRKNEEFAALAHEVTRYEKEVSSLEDKQLELMEQAEAVKPELTAAQAKLGETKKSVEVDLAQIAERGKNIEAKLAELKAERAQLAEPVDAETLTLYERILKSKGDAAIVMLESGICRGCHMKLTQATLIKIKANEEITQCEQCGRVLYTEG